MRMAIAIRVMPIAVGRMPIPVGVMAVVLTHAATSSQNSRAIFDALDRARIPQVYRCIQSLMSRQADRYSSGADAAAALTLGRGLLVGDKTGTLEPLDGGSGHWSPP